MNEFTCPSCGAIVPVRSNQTTMQGMPGTTSVDSATCATCNRTFSVIELDDFENKQALGEIPAVVVLNAVAMLGGTRTEAQIRADLSADIKVTSSGIANVPLFALRLYAGCKGIQIVPTTAAFWI